MKDVFKSMNNIKCHKFSCCFNKNGGCTFTSAPLQYEEGTNNIKCPAEERVKEAFGPLIEHEKQQKLNKQKGLFTQEEIKQKVSEIKNNITEAQDLIKYNRAVLDVIQKTCKHPNQKTWSNDDGYGSFTVHRCLDCGLQWPN